MKAIKPGQNAIGSRDLALLVAVADHGSIRRAAEALGMTQPGLSKNIRLMEEKLGTTLFERATSGAIPTAAGQMLLTRGRQVLLDLEAIQRDLRDGAHGNTGMVRIGLGALMAPMLAPWILAEMARTFPGVTIHLDVREPKDLVAIVETGNLDFAICNLEDVAVPAAVSTHLVHKDDSLQFFARPGHPLFRMGVVKPHDLAAFKLAMPPLPARLATWVSELFGQNQPAIGLQVSDYEMIGELLQQSDMISIGTAPMVATLQRRHDLAILPVGRLHFPHEIYCVQPNSRPLPPAASGVLRVVEARLASLGCEGGAASPSAGL